LIPQSKLQPLHSLGCRNRGTGRLGDAVDDLKERMRLDCLFDCRVIIFVAHCMGGILVRKLLVERAADFMNISLGLFWWLRRPSVQIMPISWLHWLG
jgi:hypothetical protein